MKNIPLLPVFKILTTAFFLTSGLLVAQVADTAYSPNQVKVNKNHFSSKTRDNRINFIVVPGYKDRTNDYAFKFDYFWASFKAFLSAGKTQLIEVDNGHPETAITEMVAILNKRNAKVGSILNDHHGRLSSVLFTFIGLELKKEDIDSSDNATVFNRKVTCMAPLIPYLDSKSIIMLGNCNLGQDAFQPLLVHLSGYLNQATIYAHMTYCMSPSLFYGAGFENLTAQQLDYGSCTVGENIEAYEAIGTWKKIQGNSIKYVGMMRIDYWGNAVESNKYFYDDGDRRDRLNQLIERLKGK